MKSMTGFGRASNRKATYPAGDSLGTSAPVTNSENKSVELDVSIRTVNGRYLEVRLHAPREYAGFENELKSVISRTFVRGTVDVYINRSRAALAPEISVNTEFAGKWLDAYRELGRSLNLKSEPSLELLTRIPEVLRVEDRVEVSDTEKDQVKSLLAEAVQACDQERQREGRALATELESLCGKLSSLSEQMLEKREEANAELQKRYRERLQKLGFEGAVEDQRIAQEIIMQLDRTDISEELTRLREHLKAYRDLLKSPEPQGKKLDFYAQELLREVNTIGSKSHIAKLTGLVVEAKTLVEKIREQVQNVE